MESSNITDEQKKFLEECENEFKDRYTERDSAFMKIKSMELKGPPIVDPWYNKQRRCEWTRPNHGHGRRNNAWERRCNDKGDRHDRYDRHSDRHYSHRNYKPY
ncbi:uncharacterized protein LOC122403522 [Colletes gigas]|uniref:uncharacterized protein LOC122403522 n=1 Tax=Colletes gigas TaxID=935657 RepID=UPI001C9AC745|nr:uncharacterized protein LOC122403522 [Colletes gigas]